MDAIDFTTSLLVLDDYKVSKVVNFYMLYIYFLIWTSFSIWKLYLIVSILDICFIVHVYCILFTVKRLE
jgi:hypothetical protein